MDRRRRLGRGLRVFELREARSAAAHASRWELARALGVSFGDALSHEALEQDGLRQTLARARPELDLSTLEPHALAEQVRDCIARGQLRLERPGRVDAPLMIGGEFIRTTPGAHAPPPPAASPKRTENPAPRHRVDGRVLDARNQPLPGVQYRLILPDGSERGGVTRSDGSFAEENIAVPGECRLLLPALES